MDWYLLFKFLHVVSAIIWLGGALIMVIFGVAADRAHDDAEMVATVRRVAWAAERIYVPASVATLVFGLITTWLGGLWSQLWVILGLLGVVATIAIGVAILSPRAKRVEASFAAGGVSPPLVALCREILAIAKFDMVLLFVVVADMVLKPQLGDWPLLVVFVLVLAGAAALFLRPMLMVKPAAA